MKIAGAQKVVVWRLQNGEKLYHEDGRYYIGKLIIETPLVQKLQAMGFLGKTKMHMMRDELKLTMIGKMLNVE